VADKKDIWVVGKDADRYDSTTDRVTGLLFDTGYNVENFPTVESTIFNLNSGIRKHPKLMVIIDRGNSGGVVHEIKPLVDRDKELNIPTIIISPTSAVQLSTTLNTTAIKNANELLGAVEKELNKQELKVGNVGFSRA
jgi:hypothetical protein